MYFVVIIFLLLLVNSVNSQDTCIDAQIALASNSDCQQLIESLDDLNTTISSVENPICTEPCYTLFNDLGNECSQQQDFVRYC